MAEHEDRGLRGDEDALYRAHHVHLLRVTRRRFPQVPDELVEDACAFAWAQLLRRQPERDAVVGWLVVVARHELLRLLGRQASACPLEEVPEPVAPRAGTRRRIGSSRRWRRSGRISAAFSRSRRPATPTARSRPPAAGARSRGSIGT